jgi:hypothetical protein
MTRTTEKTLPPTDRPGFGFNPRPRRRARVVCTDNRPTEELVAEFLKKNKIKVCEPRYADGAIRASGNYEF